MAVERRGHRRRSCRSARGRPRDRRRGGRLDALARGDRLGRRDEGSQPPVGEPADAIQGRGPASAQPDLERILERAWRAKRRGGDLRRGGGICAPVTPAGPHASEHLLEHRSPVGGAEVQRFAFARLAESGDEADQQPPVRELIELGQRPWRARTGCGRTARCWRRAGACGCVRRAVRARAADRAPARPAGPTARSRRSQSAPARRQNRSDPGRPEARRAGRQQSGSSSLGSLTGPLRRPRGLGRRLWLAVGQPVFAHRDCELHELLLEFVQPEWLTGAVRGL